MLGFLLSDHIYQIEILTLIIAIMTYKKYRESDSRYFLYYLIAVVLIETIGLLPVVNYYYPNLPLISLLKKILGEGLVESNDWIFNIYLILLYPFYFTYYKRLLYEKQKKKLVKSFIIFYAVIAIIELFVNRNDFNSSFLKISNILGVLLLFVTICVYLLQVLLSKEIFQFYKTLPFWITFGILVFSLIMGPIYIYSDILSTKNNYELYLFILKMSNYIFYGSFITGFIINAYTQKRGKSPKS